MDSSSTRSIALTAVLCICAAVTHVAALADPIKIGVSNGISGSIAPMGMDTVDGIRFANESLLHNRFELIVEDDRCDSKTGLGIAQKFISIDQVKYVLGIGCNQVLLSVAAQYAKAGVIVLAGAATSGDKADVGTGIFRPYPADHLAVGPLISYAQNRFKKLGVLTEVDEYTELMNRTFESSGAAAGITVVSERVSPGTVDYRPQLLRLKGKKVDALVLNAFGEPGYIAMVKQARELGLTAPLLANLLPASPVVREALGALDEGVVFSDLPFDETSLSAEGQSALQELNKRFGPRRSGLIFTLIGMDIVRMLAKAIDSGEPVAHYLLNHEHQGFVGTIAFDRFGAVKSLQYSLRAIEDGKAVPVPNG